MMYPKCECGETFKQLRKDVTKCKACRRDHRRELTKLRTREYRKRQAVISQDGTQALGFVTQVPQVPSTSEGETDQHLPSEP